MVDEVLVSEIVASLVKRGFTNGAMESVDDLVTQVLAVAEELGEVARIGRRIRQGVDEPVRSLIADECVDVLIAAVCLASKACGPDLGRIIKAKLAQDERRGFLHRGGSLNPLPAHLQPVAVYTPLNGGHIQRNQQRLAELSEAARREDQDGNRLWLALRMPEGYTNGLEVLGLFSDEQEAVGACTTTRDVVGPVTLGANVAERDDMWPAYYPVGLFQETRL